MNECISRGRLHPAPGAATMSTHRVATPRCEGERVNPSIVGKHEATGQEETRLGAATHSIPWNAVIGFTSRWCTW